MEIIEKGDDKMIGTEYAKGIIKTYVLADKYSDFYEYLKEKGISKIYFNACLKVMKEKDNYLYQQCLLKIKKSKITNYYQNLSRCRDLAKGIKTGIFTDGTNFDMLEFYKRLPFVGEIGRRDFLDCCEVNPLIIDSNLILGRIDKFTEVADPDSNKIIMDFVRFKRISRIRIMKEEKLRNKYQSITKFRKKVIDSNGKEFIIDKELTTSDIDKVIEYIKVNNLFFLEPVFILVLERYFIGEIKLGEKSSYKLVRNRK